MAITSFRPTTWGKEVVTSEKLNQMANNTQYVFENMPRMMYHTYGIKKTNSLKVLAGIISIQANGLLWSAGRVEFGTYFTAGCKPVIVTGTQPTGGKWTWNVILKGIGSPYPDHRGVEFNVGADYIGGTVKNVVDQRVYVHYIVIGW